MAKLQIKRADTLKEQVYRKLKSLLTSGELNHDVFYSAQQFAEKLGVSRTPAREALLQLETEGFLVAEDNRGFRVRKFSEKDACDFFEMRELMEVHAIGKFCESMTKDDLSKLEECLRQMRSACEQYDSASFIASDEEFHLVIIGSANNFFLASLIKNIRDFILIFGRRNAADEKGMKEIIEEHAQILKALKAKEKAASAAAMSRHLERTKARLLEWQQPAK